MKKFLNIMLYVLLFVFCGCSLIALTVYLYPSLINYDDGLGWLGFYTVPLYTTFVLILCLISAKGKFKSKALFTATIEAIVFMVLSLLNMFSGVVPLYSGIIMIQDIISVAILIVWIVSNASDFKKATQ